MKLLLDGNEIAWPKQILINLDGDEEVGPLDIKITGGTLRIKSIGNIAALTITTNIGSSLILGADNVPKTIMES